MDSSSFRTMTCDDLIGKTIRFRDRIQCYECDEPDPYEMCPDIGNPDNCPKKDYEVNDDYEFPAGDFWKVVRIGKAG